MKTVPTTLTAALAMAVLIVTGAASAQNYCKDYLYSTDLGGDMDLSDPSGNGIANWMDCGAIYRVNEQAQPDPVPVLWKDDDPLDGGVWTGVPFNSAPQPMPGQATPPGPSFSGFIPEQTVADAYAAYFDLDGEDQVISPPVNIVKGFQLTATEFAAAGIYVPGLNNVRLSFENDDAPGWFDQSHVSDVPSLVKTDNDFETYIAGIRCSGSLPNTAIVECDERQMGLYPYMPSAGQDHDDDVDALDWHKENDAFADRYFTVDHEAHLGLDPGDIYHTKNDGTVNIQMVIDDVNQIGVLDDTDVDAWEFVNIDIDCAETLFGTDFVNGLNPNLNVLAAIFSVDQDDPDTTAVDESGGLNPSVIYMTNLASQYAAVSGDYSGVFSENPLIENVDIDALALVPEPSAILMLLAGAVGLFGGLRRRRG